MTDKSLAAWRNTPSTFLFSQSPSSLCNTYQYDDNAERRCLYQKHTSIVFHIYIYKHIFLPLKEGNRQKVTPAKSHSWPSLYSRPYRSCRFSRIQFFYFFLYLDCYSTVYIHAECVTILLVFIIQLYCKNWKPGWKLTMCLKVQSSNLGRVQLFVYVFTELLTTSS